MKKIIYRSLGLLLSLLLISCDGFFDSVPEQSLSIDATFKSRELTFRYMANIYSYIPSEYGQRFLRGSDGPWTAGSSEAKYTWTNNVANEINSGAVYPSTSWVNKWWINYYKGIHKANMFLQNIDKCVELSEAEKLRHKTEIKALRATFYFWLLKIYGPCVLVGDKLFDPDQPSSEMQLTRSSIDECVEYIIAELTATLDSGNLRSSFDNETNAVSLGTQGSLTKEIVEALRSQVLLYAASPLFNGNPYYKDLKNADGTNLFPQTEDRTKWERAKEASKAFIDNNPGYQLILLDKEKKEVSDVALSCPYNSCRAAVIGENKENREMIFYNTGGSNELLYYDMTPKHSIVNIDPGYRGGGALSATQEMVDLFFTDKGLRIEDDPDYYTYNNEELGKKILKLSPYTDKYSGRTYIDGEKQVMRQYYNRESRFYLNITFNNQCWWFLTKSGNVYSEFNNNGNSGPSKNGNDYSFTGYVVRKKMIEGAWGSNGRYAALIRLAEIYLNYAEAANECGDLDEAIKYLNKIRARAGVPEYKGQIGEDVTAKDLRGNDRIDIAINQETLRNLIRRERAVELAFENHRYFDVRRWNVADMAVGDGWVYPSNHNGGEGGDTHGMSIYKDGTAFYEKVVFEKRVFSEKMNLFPIPQTEIDRNKLMIQNTGWGN